MSLKKAKSLKTILFLLLFLVVLLSVKLMMSKGIIDLNMNTNTGNVIVSDDGVVNSNSDSKEVKKNKVDNEVVVGKGDTITVDYIGKFEDGKVFDTSIESVAKDAGIYQTGRDYKNGLSFQAGMGQMIPGFDNAVIGMKIGDQKTITLQPKDAYGEWSEKNVKIISFDQLPPKPDNSSYVEGDVLQSQYGPVKVVGITDTGVKLDFNNPMAGKTLIFVITIKDIKKSK